MSSGVPRGRARSRWVRSWRDGNGAAPPWRGTLCRRRATGVARPRRPRSSMWSRSLGSSTCRYATCAPTSRHSAEPLRRPRAGVPQAPMRRRSSTFQPEATARRGDLGVVGAAADRDGDGAAQRRGIAPERAQASSTRANWRAACRQARGTARCTPGRRSPPDGACAAVPAADDDGWVRALDGLGQRGAVGEGVVGARRA